MIAHPVNNNFDHSFNNKVKVMVKLNIVIFLIKMTKSNHNILIRSARLEDMQKIIQVQFDAIRTLCANDYSPQELSALLKDKSHPRSWSEITFVAEIGGEIAGFASLMRLPSIIAAVFVKPRFARKGIGTKLLQSLEQEAVRRNCRVLSVNSSLTGHGFYLANGYQTLRRTKIVINSVAIPCICLQKRLVPATIFEKFWDSLLQYLSNFLSDRISWARKLINKVLNKGKR